jgi:endonuclease YncB( thermonuclease family)
MKTQGHKNTVISSMLGLTLGLLLGALAPQNALATNIGSIFVKTRDQSTQDSTPIPNKKTGGNKEWEILRNCKLIPFPNNDGDSFLVEHKNKQYVFRLYMVDCPETSYSHNYRILQQMAYFGSPHRKLIHSGKLASYLVNSILARPFTVVTRWEGALGSGTNPRYYGFVLTQGGKDLGELLLEHGLARSHGKEVKVPPQIMKQNNLRKHYDTIEKRVKSQGLGAWGPSPIPRIHRPSLSHIKPSQLQDAQNLASNISKKGGQKLQQSLQDYSKGKPPASNPTNNEAPQKSRNTIFINQPQMNIRNKENNKKNKTRLTVNQGEYIIGNEELKDLLPLFKPKEAEKTKNID